MPKINYKQASRANWVGEGSNVDKCSEFPGIDYVNMASLQRIADATELMAKRHQELLADVDWHMKRGDRWKDNAEKYQRQIKALKGVITKLKKKHNG